MLHHHFSQPLFVFVVVVYLHILLVLRRCFHAILQPHQFRPPKMYPFYGDRIGKSIIFLFNCSHTFLALPSNLFCISAAGKRQETALFFSLSTLTDPLDTECPNWPIYLSSSTSNLTIWSSFVLCAHRILLKFQWIVGNFLRSCVFKWNSLENPAQFLSSSHEVRIKIRDCFMHDVIHSPFGVIQFECIKRHFTHPVLEQTVFFDECKKQKPLLCAFHAKNFCKGKSLKYNIKQEMWFQLENVS